MRTTRSAPRGTKRRVGIARRLLASSVAVGLSSAGVIGGLATPAGAEATSGTAECFLDIGMVGTLRLGGSGYPPNETFSSFVFITWGNGTTSRGVVPFETDPAGNGRVTTQWADNPGFPWRIGLAVFRDTNGNGRWDPDVDDNLYRGSGTVTACPQTTTLAPK